MYNAEIYDALEDAYNEGYDQAIQNMLEAMDYEDIYYEAYEDVDVFDDNYFEAMEGNKENKDKRRQWESERVGASVLARKGNGSWTYDDHLRHFRKGNKPDVDINKDKRSNDLIATADRETLLANRVGRRSNKIASNPKVDDLDDIRNYRNNNRSYNALKTAVGARLYKDKNGKYPTSDNQKNRVIKSFHTSR